MENIMEGGESLTGYSGGDIIREKEEKQKLKNSTLGKVTFYKVDWSEFEKKMIEKNAGVIGINEGFLELLS